MCLLPIDSTSPDMPQSVVLISTSEKNPQYLNLLYFRVVLHQICAADIRKWSSYHIICKSSPKELVHAGNQDAMRGSVPLSKPTWRHAKIFSGVNKYLTPTCLWMMTKACQLSKKPFSLVIKHTKSLSLQNQVFKHLQKVTHERSLLLLDLKF